MYRLTRLLVMDVNLHVSSPEQQGLFYRLEQRIPQKWKIGGGVTEENGQLLGVLFKNE